MYRFVLVIIILEAEQNVYIKDGFILNQGSSFQIK